MKRNVQPFLYFCALLLLLMAIPTIVMAAEAIKTREVPLKLESPLKGYGIEANVASILPAEIDSSQRTISVFITFAQGFYGELYLKGYRNGKEIARSGFVTVNQRAERGGNVRFSFDKDTNLNEITSVTLDGSKKTIPAPKEESWGETATQIVKELLE